MYSKPGRRFDAWARCCGVALIVGAGALATPGVSAQDAVRGASLYLQLPRGIASCVSCHGPDPTQNRNRLLLAADRPEALLRALNTVSVMGYLRSELSDADVGDLAAYLGRVLVVSSDTAPLALWPATIEFGSLPAGSASALFRVRLANRSVLPQAFVSPPRADPALRLSHDCPASLAPGAFCELRLQQPAAGAVDAGGGVVWPLAAAGAPLLTAWSASTGSAGALSVEPEGVLDFGQTSAGTRVDREVVLLSSGPLPVTLGLTTLTGPDRGRFALGTGCAAGTVLPPGSRCTVTVSYLPSVAGSASAGLQWRSDGRNPGNLMLDGRAVVGATPAPAPAPPVTPPAASPTAPPVSVPSPLPAPAPLPEAGGGGCSMAAPSIGGVPAQVRFDPLWPLSVLLALGALAYRRRRAP